MTSVIENLWLGDFKDASGLVLSNPDSIAGVITLCEEPVSPRDPRIAYDHFPVSDSRPIAGARLEAILWALESSVAHRPTLLHCQAGISRTPTLAAAFLVRRGFGSFPRALQHLAQIRPEIGPSPILLESVIRHLQLATR